MKILWDIHECRFCVRLCSDYFAAAVMMDRLGRKPIQVLGFAMLPETKNCSLEELSAA